MDPRRINAMSMKPVAPAQKERQRAEKVAGQFESVFVRTLVSSLRQTASVGSEGIFGEGPGADTYSDWFDQNLAEQISHSGHIGIADQLMRDFTRYGAISKAAAKSPPKPGDSPATAHLGLADRKLPNGPRAAARAGIADQKLGEFARHHTIGAAAATAPGPTPTQPAPTQATAPVAPVDTIDAATTGLRAVESARRAARTASKQPNTTGGIDVVLG